MPRPTLVLALALAALASLAFWSLPNRPEPLTGAAAAGPIESVSFAPFRRGQSPLAEVYPSPAEVEADLAALQGLVKGVRTYTSREGLERVPEVAGRYGIEVTHSAWLGSRKRVNDLEVAALIQQANRHPDTIKRVIVGNEVLLRRDLKPDQLAGYIRQVKQAVSQPVSYADVWEFWLKNPELALEVDFITVHFLPYWEDQPVGVADAMTHILQVWRSVRQAFPGKPILIGEVGWPSAGRARQEAVPGRWQAAEFINAFRRLAAEHGMAYNLVEAFDQPWKSLLEGTVGANWGILDVDRQPKFPLSGPVVENPDWPLYWLCTTLLTLLAAASMALARPGLAPRGIVWLVALATVFATMLTAAAFEHWLHSYAWAPALDGVLKVLLQGALAWLILRQAAERLAQPQASRPGSLTLQRSGHWLLLVAGLLAFSETFMLVWNGRYRDFPTLDLLVPAFGLPLAQMAIFALCRAPRGPALLSLRNALGMPGPGQSPSAGLEGWFAFALLLAAVALIISETPWNREAMIWALCVLALALPYAIEWRLRPEMRPALAA